MPTYISLMRFTEQGVKAVKDHPKRREAAAKGIEAMGGKLLHTYLTMGRYDVVAVLDLPDDDAAAKFALITGRQGNVSTETMRAFDEGEFDRLLNSL
ncbi:MAG: GYD domain-containing protein [Chloroflexi bacterium]|nr:MAG: GYD domain-containing protein [Chloroflexota bacterium]